LREREKERARERETERESERERERERERGEKVRERVTRTKNDNPFFQHSQRVWKDNEADSFQFSKIFPQNNGLCHFRYFCQC
jgi:hypothetical protein